MDKKNSPIDPKEIEIKISKLDPPDYRLDYLIPQKLTKRIHKKLKKGGHDYSQQQMVALLTQICISEGMERLDKNTVWGPKPLMDAETPVFSIGKPFVFSTIIDTFSTDDIAEFGPIPIERLNIDITDEMIDNELLEQQLEIGTREPHSGPLDNGDEVVGDVTLTIEDENEPLFTITSCHIRIPVAGNKTVIGEFRFADATEQLHGIQPDGVISIQLAIPTEYPIQELRGKTATLQVDVDSVERITPASVEDVLEQYGSPNETILRSQIQLSLKRNFERENDVVMLNQMYTHLENTLELPIPQRIINMLFEDLCNRSQESEAEDGDLSEEKKELILQRVKFVTKRRAITVRMQEFLDLRINEKDIDDQIRNIAERRRVRPEDIRAEFISEDKLHQLGNISMEQKIFNKLKVKMEFNENQFSDISS